MGGRHWFTNALIVGILLFASWAIWLPWFIPIARLQIIDLHQAGDKLYLTLLTTKYLPCAPRGTALRIESSEGSFPVVFYNPRNGLELGKGATSGVPGASLPLRVPNESELVADLASAQPLAKDAVLKGTVHFSCNSWVLSALVLESAIRGANK